MTDGTSDLVFRGSDALTFGSAEIANHLLDEVRTAKGKVLVVTERCPLATAVAREVGGDARVLAQGEFHEIDGFGDIELVVQGSDVDLFASWDFSRLAAKAPGQSIAQELRGCRVLLELFRARLCFQTAFLAITDSEADWECHHETPGTFTVAGRTQPPSELGPFLRRIRRFARWMRDPQGPLGGTTVDEWPHVRGIRVLALVAPGVLSSEESGLEKLEAMEGWEVRTGRAIDDVLWVPHLEDVDLLAIGFGRLRTPPQWCRAALAYAASMDVPVLLACTGTDGGWRWASRRGERGMDWLRQGSPTGLGTLRDVSRVSDLATRNALDLVALERFATLAAAGRPTEHLIVERVVRAPAAGEAGGTRAGDEG